MYIELTQPQDNVGTFIFLVTMKNKSCDSNGLLKEHDNNMTVTSL